MCECVEREGRCARKGVVRLPVCRCLESERVGGGIERKRVTSLRGWGDLSMDGGEGRRIANPRGSEESWFERKAEKGGKRDASASRSEGVGRGGEVDWSGGVRHTGFWFDWIAIGPRDWLEGKEEDGCRTGCWFITTRNGTNVNFLVARDERGVVIGRICFANV